MTPANRDMTQMLVNGVKYKMDMIIAAKNILAAGQAVSACGAGRAQAPVMKQEPACGAR